MASSERSPHQNDAGKYDAKRMVYQYQYSVQLGPWQYTLLEWSVGHTHPHAATA